MCTSAARTIGAFESIIMLSSLLGAKDSGKAFSRLPGWGEPHTYTT